VRERVTFNYHCFCCCCFAGVLYDNVAGVPAQVDLHLRDYFGNRLQVGGRNIELALLGVGGESPFYCAVWHSLCLLPPAKIESCPFFHLFLFSNFSDSLLRMFFLSYSDGYLVDWGTVQPFPQEQGLPNSYFYRGEFMFSFLFVPTAHGFFTSPLRNFLHF
jgi:hypothetical protein